MTRRVLVVDDSRLNRLLLSRILSDDYEVLQAENGLDAIDILRGSGETISAVLLDIIMPVMDGYEVLSQMRADDKMSMIPVIVATSDTDVDAEVRCLSLGANDVIIKPYNPVIIRHRLWNTINLRETAAIINQFEKDILTGVYSKEFFYKKAEFLINVNPRHRYDIVCCDVERFKLINDLFGGATGDALLKHLAQQLLRGMNGMGLCGRIGADKFACLLPHREKYDGEWFAEEIRAVNEFPISIYINVCYGIYVIDDTSLPISTMCDRALTACDSIKGKYGSDFAYYDDGFRQKALNEQFIVDGMKTGLIEKQFQVYYQPKYSLQTEEVVGAEALVRWIHPERGFLSPADFIPIFEKNGFITDLDVYVWDTACSHLRAWIDAGNKPLPVSVNVSRTDIYNPELEHILVGLLQKHRLEPGLLHLEITETAYTEDAEQLINTVARLKELGFLIEMDDFGKGYSSLNMLADLPINILKLDMSFIVEAENDRRKNILSVIIYLAHKLGLPVVAEGVETSAQKLTLREMGCGFAQGFYYAKPMPKEEFEAHLKRAASELKAR